MTKPGIFLGKRAKSQALALPLLLYLTTKRRTFLTT